MDLQSLITKANRAIDFRGHKLVAWQIYHGESRSLANYECPACGAEAQCNSRPMPNGIDIGGSAVAVYCNPTTSTQQG